MSFHNSRDPDTMDTTPGHTRARKIDADERTELMRCYVTAGRSVLDVSSAVV